MTKEEKLEQVCSQFTFMGNFDKAEPYGDGHINDTFKVTYVDDDKEPTQYILQRVNHLVFKNTVGLMENIEHVTSYLSSRITKDQQADGYEILTLIKTKGDKSYIQDDEGNFWRAYVFVKNATGHTFAEDVNMLYEAGKAFGQFQRLLSEYPAESLIETIEGFHNTVWRFENLKNAVQEDLRQRADQCREEIQFALSREDMASTLVRGLESGVIPLRVTHNDTKINNVLLDDATGNGRCVIDLDTVMPGSALYDYGDAIRSCGSTIAEDGENLEDLKVNFEKYKAYTKGFLEAMGQNLTPQEIKWLPLAAIIMTLECGVRFLTDYLEGDNYFKIHKENHNLIRARNQFKFVAEMEMHIDVMTEIVNKYWKDHGVYGDFVKPFINYFE